MGNKDTASAGGKARAITQRQESLDRYYLNPNYCKLCGTLISVPDNTRVAQIRNKQFCNHSCSSIYSNTHRIRIRKDKPMKLSKSNATIHTLTKAEFILCRKDRVNARIAICRHARTIFQKANPILSCKVCGYTKIVECCHIRDVADWPDDTLIGVINHPDNLVGLCPNHHWEFDNDGLVLS